MSAFYNEFDSKAAAWLRELVAQGHISAGVVDERSICELSADDVLGHERVHLFAGVAGWDYAFKLAGWPDGVPVWTGSCPCQPFSAAGKRRGVNDERHLWPEMYRLIRECRPEYVIGEQVSSAIGYGWLDGVCADLEAEGYACGACVLGAHSVGAPHIRQRLYWVAHAEGPSGRLPILERQPQQNSAEPEWCIATSAWDDYRIIGFRDGKARRIGTGIEPLVDGFPGRTPLLRGYGNAIVPQVAAQFIGAFMDVMEGTTA